MGDLTKTEKFNLALLGEDPRPDWVPDIKWRGKMDGPLADFCTSMIAAGHPDSEIHEICLEYFGGPKTIKVIRRLRDTHSKIIAEKVEALSREMATIPIAHKAYRLKILNDMVVDLLDKWHSSIDESSAQDAERLSRALSKTIASAQKEMEGTTVNLNQQNVYINAVQNVSSDELDELIGSLSEVHSKIRDMVGADDEIIDTEFEAEDERLEVIHSRQES